MSGTISRLVLILLSLALVAVAAPPLAAQDEAATAAHIYEAYYKVNFADLPAWTEDFRTHHQPVLDRMVEEGVIDGYGHWQHNVGGDHNVRLGIRVFDWASIETFWDRYLGEVSASMSDDQMQESFGMVEEHYDEIWDITSVTVPEGAPINHMYASTFNVEFNQWEEWDRMWEEQIIPILSESMEAGVLSGVVLLTHNTGLAHNKKVLYLFEDWDDMDDMWNAFFEKMEARHPEDLGAVLSMVRAHDDIIWSAPPPAGGN